MGTPVGKLRPAGQLSVSHMGPLVPCPLDQSTLSLQYVRCALPAFNLDEIDVDEHDEAYFLELFDDSWTSRWQDSSHPKYNGKFHSWSPNKFWGGDDGLRANTRHRFYGIGSLLDEPLDPSKGFVFQVHLILRHQSPLDGSIVEKHHKNHAQGMFDKIVHVYTLRVFPNNSFEVLYDGNVQKNGTFTDDDTMEPPISPPVEIPDPSDPQPKDWVTEEEIADPDAKEPADWSVPEWIPDQDAKMPSGWLENEPKMIRDPAASKPDEWDDREDGAWEAPKIKNPKCKVGCGKWSPPMKKNSKFKGKWEPPMIPNPAYKGPWVNFQKHMKNEAHFVDNEPLKHIGLIGGVALEFWSTDTGYIFDSIVLAADDDVPRKMREQIWKPKYDLEYDRQEKQQRKLAAEKSRINKSSEVPSQAGENSLRADAVAETTPDTMIISKKDKSKTLAQEAK
eukprot:gene14992-21050_t